MMAKVPVKKKASATARKKRLSSIQEIIIEKMECLA